MEFFVPWLLFYDSWTNNWKMSVFVNEIGSLTLITIIQLLRDLNSRHKSNSTNYETLQIIFIASRLQEDQHVVCKKLKLILTYKKASNFFPLIWDDFYIDFYQGSKVWRHLGPRREDELSARLKQRQLNSLVKPHMLHHISAVV